RSASSGRLPSCERRAPRCAIGWTGWRPRLARRRWRGADPRPAKASTPGEEAEARRAARRERPLHVGDDVARRRRRVRCVEDRAPDDEVIGPVPDRLARREDALLVAVVGLARPDAGRHDEEAPAALAPDARDL